MVRSTIIAIALGACASSPAKPPAAAPVPAPAAAPAPDNSVFGLAELAIYDKSGTLVMKLHADGSFEVHGTVDGKDVWKQIGTFARDGTFTSNTGDKMVFGADGTITASNGASHKLFEGETLVIRKDKRVRYDDNGVYYDNDQPTPGKVEGAHDAKTRHTALAMIAIGLIAAQQAQSSQ